MMELYELDLEDVRRESISSSPGEESNCAVITEPSHRYGVLPWQWVGVVRRMYQKSRGGERWEGGVCGRIGGSWGW